MYNSTGAKREVRAGAGPPPGTAIPNSLAAPVGCRLSSAVVSAADHVDHAIFFPWAEAPSGFGSCMLSNTHNHLDAFFSFFFSSFSFTGLCSSKLHKVRSKPRGSSAPAAELNSNANSTGSTFPIEQAMLQESKLTQAKGALCWQAGGSAEPEK